MRVYDLLLRLYPASFRNEYGDEMRPLFARRRAQATGLGIVTLWLGTIGEVVANAIAVHVDILKQDVSYTGRVLRRSRGFAITAVLIVALGVGATTAAFSITDFVLLRPLPFPEPDRIVTLWEHMPKFRNNLSPANFRDWTGASISFERAGMYHPQLSSLTGTGDPIRVEGASVSADVLRILGVSPLLGRTFADTDDGAGAPGTLLLGYRFWQTQFGGDPNVVGRKVLMDDEPFTVIGVMPREFSFPAAEWSSFWMPLRLSERESSDRSNHSFNGIARLRRGVTLEQARAEMDVITARSRQEHPAENKDASADVLRFSDEVPEQSRLMLYALGGASACVLLIACANLANLLLARALGRRRELAVRTAIGAGRERMIRQLMTESLLLAVMGGALGVLVAYAGVPLLNQLVPVTLPLAVTPTVDLRVLLFAMTLTIVTGLAFGLAPVMRVGGDASLTGLREGARSGGGQKEGARSALVVVEIIASVVLLVSAGLLLRALLNVRSVDPGFRAEGVLTMQTPLPMPKYAKTPTREAFYTHVLTGLRALPGVTNAAFVSFLPMGRMRGGVWSVAVDGQPVVPHGDSAYLRYVTPGYFATIGTPLRSGRDVAGSDAADRQFVAIVSESFVRRYWPKETMTSVLGRSISFASYDRTVVGVVGDIRMRGLESDASPQVYLPSAQGGDRAILGFVPRGLVVRSTMPPESLTASIRAIVREADPMMPVAEVNPMTAIVERDTASRSTQVRVLGVFALIAFVLAAIGIHGLLSFAVSQRVQEIGVRVALGARSSDILSMVMWRGAILAIAGIVPGVLLAYAAGRSMEALLAGVKPADGPTLAAAVALAFLMTILGTLAPTLRALRVDPITALRAE
jgi:putative ABC transport system permease protein